MGKFVATLITVSLMLLGLGAMTANAGQLLSTSPNQVGQATAESATAPTKRVNAGAEEQTPSRAEYFSWINNSNEGSTEQQTLINLNFFRWLREQYGMQLDIYAWDAGNLDGARSYATMDKPRFKAAYPRGWQPSVDSAAALGCRLGLWGGPDGYGNTPQEEQARHDLLVSLCRAYHFALFKWDGVCGTLRPEKQEAVIQTLEECRQYCPDLIVLNHRLELGKARPYVTTWLWEGAETYIDVFMPNRATAPHHRAGAISRGLTPRLQRLTEDHGVCLSSCLDYWDDDLVLQAFNRSLLLAPEIYGNPWLLRDDEFPKLARLFNLHRRYGNVLVNAMVLPESQYGPCAVARGDQSTRFITLRNLSWNPLTYRVQLDESIGLTKPGQIEVRRFHPHERALGRFRRGTKVAVEVQPFRSCLIMATSKPCNEIGVSGCEAEVVCDVQGKPARIQLLGLPGTTDEVSLKSGRFTFSQASMDGRPLAKFAEGKPVKVAFPGRPLAQSWHRKLINLEACPVPADAEALYEATCFAADNDALEVRSLRRSGPSSIPAVQKARDAFFAQSLFCSRGCCDHLLFDGDTNTAFAATADAFRSGTGAAVSPSAQLRLDLGAPTQLDRLVIRVAQGTTTGPAEYSSDLAIWTKAQTLVTNSTITIIVPGGQVVRYVRINRGSLAPTEVNGIRDGKLLPRELWRASNLFDSYAARIAESAWSGTVTLDEAAPGSYLCVALEGEHGNNGAWVAARLDGAPIGCPDRAPSFDSNTWEHKVDTNCQSNYTYYLPITPPMLGRKLDLVALTLKGGKNSYQPTVWITTENPFVAREVVLQ